MTDGQKGVESRDDLAVGVVARPLGDTLPDHVKQQLAQVRAATCLTVYVLDNLLGNGELQDESSGTTKIRDVEYPETLVPTDVLGSVVISMAAAERVLVDLGVGLPPRLRPEV
jgi:hypothetical protein